MGAHEHEAPAGVVRKLEWKAGIWGCKITDLMAAVIPLCQPGRVQTQEMLILIGKAEGDSQQSPQNTKLPYQSQGFKAGFCLWIMPPIVGADSWHGPGEEIHHQESGGACTASGIHGNGTLVFQDPISSMPRTTCRKGRSMEFLFQ